MNKSSSVIVVIPARWGSTRFAGKMLHPIAGRPLIEHVWRRCGQARFIKQVIIATDDKRIKEVAEKFGAEVIMTSKHHQSGTDRVAEVARLLQKRKTTAPSHLINVQGDEPLLDARLIDRLARTMLRSQELEMITAATPFNHVSHRNDPHSVKVVLTRQGNALYFSRSMIPFHRDHKDADSAVQPLLHLGIYGFRSDILQRLVRYRPSPLECCEKLEQLRALENGISIRVITTSHAACGVDTLDDAMKVEALLASQASKKFTKMKINISTPRQSAPVL